MRCFATLVAALSVFLLCVLGAAAQEDLADGPDDNGFIINLIQDRLSTDSRKIRLSGVQGALSSQARVTRITISDAEGIWLQIDNAEIDWNRRALLRGRLEINSLSAERISLPRRPVAQPGLPDPTPRSFAVPELPVAVSLGELSVQRIELGEPVIGVAAEIEAQGSLILADGSIDTTLAIDRLDGAGGSFALTVQYANETGILDLALDASEPPNGVIANLVKLKDRPALEARITANGPLDDLVADIDFNAGGQDLVDGRVTVGGPAGERRMGVDLTGRFQPLVPEALHSFFAEQSTLAAQARQLPQGGIAVDSFALDSGGLRTEGSLVTAPDGFPEELDLAMQLGDPGGGRLVLPFGDGRTSVSGGTLSLSLGQADQWQGALRLDGLEAGSLSMTNLSLDMGGRALNLADPVQRRVTARIEGGATGFGASDAGLATALGDTIGVVADLDWTSGQPLRVNIARIEADAGSIDYIGTITGTVLSGDVAVAFDDLALFAAVTGRGLAGSLDATASGFVDPLSGAFDMAVDGSAMDLRTGTPQLDPLLEGPTTMSGRLVRDERGVTAEEFRIGSERAEITADGIYALQGTEFDFTARVDDIGRITDQGSGPLQLAISATGGPDALSLDADLRMPRGRLQGRDLSDGILTLQATGRNALSLSGRIAGRAALGGVPVRTEGEFELRDGAQILRAFEFDAGETRLRGTVARGTDGLVAGTVEVSSPDISQAAALALTDAAGSVEARLILSRSAGRQRVAASGELRAFTIPGIAIGELDLDATITDLFGVPLADGRISASRVEVGGFAIESFAARAETVNQRMEVNARTRLANGAEADFGGALENLQPGYQFDLARLNLATPAGDASLTAPSRLVFRDGELSLTPLGLRTGEGMLTLAGQVGRTLAVEVALRDVPLALANGVMPELGLAGAVTGTATIGGTPEFPDGSFAMSADGVSAQAIRALGLPPLALAVEGRTVGRAVSLAGQAEADGFLDVVINGIVPFDPRDATLEVTVLLRQLELNVFDAMAGSVGLRGSVSGEATVDGSTADPNAVFTVNATNLSATALSEAGVTGTSLQATGGYRGGVVDIETLGLRGAGNLSFDGGGRIPLQGQGLDVRANGTVPLALANVPLARAGVQLDGTMNIAATASGSLAAPDLQGTATVSNATIVSLPLNLRLNGVQAQARFQGNRVIIEQVSGALNGGGQVALTGSIGIDPAARFPADLRLALRDAVYTDGTLVTTRITGDLALTGPVLGRGGMASGEVFLERTEIVIPSRFGINEGVLLDIEHRNPPRDVVMTLERAGLRGGPADTGPAVDIGLNVLVRAPNQLFIRGRGLDAEMGGEVRITGRLSDISPIGQIDMIRGRLGLLGKRIDFDQGSVTLIGDLNPRIRLSATTRSAQGVTIFVTVDGPASDPQISFTSSPDLPQDEVLALLIFDRNVADLSPLQVAQLASAAATLAGSGGGGVADSLRSSIGLANLDVTTGEDGEVGVRAGAYIVDNVYLDVEADSAGGTRATINLDITESLRARASVDNAGDSTIGIFFERDY